MRIALFAHEDANYVRLGTQIRKCMDAIAAAMPGGYKLKVESDAAAKVGKEARGRRPGASPCRWRCCCCR